jgi:hypothetical protein
MTDDRTKTHAKACMKIIMSILRRSHSPRAGHSVAKEFRTADTADCVKIWYVTITIHATERYMGVARAVLLIQGFLRVVSRCFRG